MLIFKSHRNIFVEQSEMVKQQFHFLSSWEKQLSSVSSSRNHRRYSHASPLVLTWTKTLRGFLPIFATARSRWFAICEAQKVFSNDPLWMTATEMGQLHIVQMLCYPDKYGSHTESKLRYLSLWPDICQKPNSSNNLNFSWFSFKWPHNFVKNNMPWKKQATDCQNQASITD